jgi:hypothetical protein
LTAALVFVATPALAVPVGTSADTRPAAPQHRPHWTDGGVQFKVDGSYLAGNVNFTSLAVNLAANYNDGPHQLFLDAGNFYNASGSNVLVQRLAASTLYAYAARDNFNTYAYVTGAHDLSIKLNHRITAGLGACVHKLFPDFFSLFLVSLNPAYELESFNDGATPSALRGVVRVNAIKPLGEVLEMGFDSFYTPAMLDPSDMRLYGEAYVRVKLAGDALALRFTVADEYDSQPRPGVLSNDVGIFSSLEANWGK